MNNTTSLSPLSLICESYLSQIPAYQKPYFQIAFGINTVIATSLNVLTCIVLYKTPSITIGSYYLIVSLAISDLLVGMVISPAAAFSLANSCMLNKVGGFVAVLLAPTGITICAIAYDRYLRIHDEEISIKKRFVVTILLPWLSPLLLVVFKLVGDLAYTAVIIAIFIGAYMLVFISYLQLIRSLHRVVRPANLEVRFNVVTAIAVIQNHGKDYKDNKGTTKDKDQNIMIQRNTNAIPFILALICVFVFFSSGIFIVRCLTFAELLSEEFAIKFQTYKYTMRAIAQLMFHVNSSVNPLLYFLRIPKIKRSLVEILK